MNTLSTRPTILLCLLLFLCSLSPVAADEGELPFPFIVVPPEPISGFEIHWEDLLGSNAVAPNTFQLHGPFHGAITTIPEGLYYAAQPSLWQARFDSFILDYRDGVDRTRQAINVVIMVGKPVKKGQPVVNLFDENAPGHSDWYLHDPAGVVSTSDSRLLIPNSPVDSFVYAHLPEQQAADLVDDFVSHAGSSTTGVGTGILLTPPPGGLAQPPGFESRVLEQVFYSGGPTNYANSVKGWLRLDSSGLQAWIEAVDETNVWRQSPVTVLSSHQSSLLEVEYDDSVDAPEVARLRVNGVLATSTPEAEAGDVSTEATEHRIGVMQPAGADSIHFEVEDVEVYRYRIHGEVEPGQADDFEVSELGWPSWSGWSGGGLARVERETLGKHWMRVDLTAGDSYLIDTTPQAAKSTRLRFDLDTTAQGHSVIVKALAAHHADAVASANEHLRVFVRRHIFGSEVRVDILGAAWHSTGWRPLLDTDVNRVELTFRAAPNAGVDDGELHVWLDGVELPAITGIANHQNLVEAVRFGAMDIAPFSTGQIHLDNFQVWVPHNLTP